MLLAEQDRLEQYFKIASPMTLLAVQDTTELDLTGNRVADKIGSLNLARRKGYQVHNHLLLDKQGISLGLFDQYLWNRDPAYFGQDRNNWQLKDKESYRWLVQFEKLQEFFSRFPQHTVINTCDREADFYELFQARKLPNVHLLVRSKKDKLLSNGKKLWATLAEQEQQDTYEANIFDKKGKKHQVTFRVKFCPMTIPPTNRAWRDQRERSNPVDLHGILVEQTSPLQDWQEKPIVWRLLTTLSVETFEQALQVIEFYVLRWRIEEFHYVLKQGCKIEQTQLKEPQAVENAITFYSLLAWKVMNLRYAASEASQESIENFGFTQKQYLVMATFLNALGRTRLNLKNPCPNIGEFAQLIANLATTAKHKKRPVGVKALWIGFEKLHLLIKAYETFT